MNFQDKLAELNACREAREWVGDRTPEQAWAECPRADWMLWLAERAGVDRRTLVGVSAVIARDVLPIFETHRPGDTRIRKCLDACDKYAEGEDVDLGPYRYAAYAAAHAADTLNTATHSDAVVIAAEAAAYATAADATRAAADAANAANVKRKAQARHAGIVRKMIPFETLKKAMEDQDGR